jgi:NAD(P) transhydrogenase subunit alpha
VRAFDPRPSVKDQVRSMGAEFIEVDVKEEGEGAGGYAKEMSPAFIAAEMAMFAAQAREVDIIITTALIPNRPAPVLITEDMVKTMKKGSVIVDLAAENGGNCAVTQPGAVVDRYGVHVVGYVDLPSRLAPTATQLYGSNLAHLLTEMGGAKTFHVDLDDEIVRGALVLLDGKVMWPPPRKEPPPAAPEVRRATASLPAIDAAAAKKAVKQPSGARKVAGVVGLAGLAIALVALGLVAPAAFLSHLTVFALACVIGFQVIWNVTPALHTPLMSVTNAISGIIVVGGMLQVSGPLGSPAVILGAAAILLAAINIAGGFLVTQRMLRMFRK